MVWWCGGVVVWWCGGVVVWWCGGVVCHPWYKLCGLVVWWCGVVLHTDIHKHMILQHQNISIEYVNK